MEDRVSKIARILKVSPQEAQQVINDDQLIDLGGRCDWEISPEEEKLRRKMGKINIRKIKRKGDK